MLTVALAELKTHARRFIAISLAVLLAVAFLAATLMVSSSTQATLKASVGQAFAKADLIISAPAGKTLNLAAAEAVGKLGMVQSSYAQITSPIQVNTDSGTLSGTITNTSPTPALEATVVTSGRLPSSADEVVVDSTTASRQHLQLGSTISLSALHNEGASSGPAAIPVTVVGIMTPSHDPRLAAESQFVAGTDTVTQLAGATSSAASAASSASAPPLVSTIQLKLSGAADQSAVQAIQQALRGAGFPAATVLTADQQTTHAVAGFTGGADQLTIILLAFAGIAIVVSALVVSNTFSVLIAQRTRELALLRCVGAGRGQIRRSVLLEALLVGLTASVLGVLAAVGVMASLIAVLRNNPDYQFATLAVPPTAIAAGLVAGTVLTLVAALVPARAATAVAPLAALRPLDDASLKNRRGVLRLSSGALLVLVGGAALVYGSASSTLLLALPGGAASFVGVLLCASLFIPAVVAAAGRVAAPFGVPGKLAAVNAVRNPARTAATAAALLIGVTLVTMMMTGAATARNAFDSTLNAHYPVDASVSGPARDGRALTQDQVLAASRLAGVQAAALLPTVGVATLDGGQVPVYGISSADAAAMLATSANPVAPGVLLAPKGITATSTTVTSGSVTKQLPVQAASTREFPALVNLETLPAAASTADSSAAGSSAPGSGTEAAGTSTAGASNLVWLKLDDSLNQQQLLDLRSQLAQTLNVDDYQVQGGALEKATFGQVVDLLLLVVTALLGVAVLIALIGVANTLSLSVLERTRENSLLRALGLTRSQLRTMLAIEAVLIAGVAAVMGSVLGVLYGWLGAQSALGTFATVTATVPWGQVLLVVLIAAGAGLAASVIPARRAARLSPRGRPRSRIDAAPDGLTSALTGNGQQTSGPEPAANSGSGVG
ncbi:FtsX-like permease family protein [Paenarthrobacter sp. Z7-10]|uniref:ABC transporter permease n=1 Tax=Paenarthrobacter sp. Z7-10 TaxID=2787635 RepID=UPI0022A97272|nr:FtsX family ABC transporter permease [Paenarthrobacter sp. Z7-10]MCZ2403098.1 FtsX-like permease family protein [Paenarthrobacter sp. Z7-10]